MLIAVAHGRRAGGALRLSLEQLVDGRLALVSGARLVPISDEDFQLRVVEQAQAVNLAFGVGRGLFENLAEVERHARHRLGGEEVAVVVELGDQPAARFEHGEREVELRRAALDRHLAEAQTRQLHRLGRRVLQHEPDLEEQVAAQVALGLQLVNQTLEGQVLMLVGVERHVLDAREQLAEGRAAREVCAERERVGEKSYEVFHLGAVAARYRGSDDDIVLRCVTIKKRHVAGQKRHEKRRVRAQAEPLETLAQLRPQDERVVRAAVGVDGRAHPVGRKLKAGGDARQSFAPV